MQFSLLHRMFFKYIGQYRVVPQIALSLWPSGEVVPSIAAIHRDASAAVL